MIGDLTARAIRRIRRKLPFRFAGASPSIATVLNLDVDGHLPVEFNPFVYSREYPDLANFNESRLRRHYHEFGKSEGRRCHSVPSRQDFVALIDDSKPVLEIGPFCSPMLRGANVKYVDVFNTAELRWRAGEYGLDVENVPEIDWVSSASDLRLVDEKFDYVVSSHVVEHQPDFANHLGQVSGLLNSGGRYFLLIPDHRYCFDHFQASSTIAQVIGAHLEKRKVHSATSVVEHRVFTTHNDPSRHWASDHGDQFENRAHRLRSSSIEYLKSGTEYLDVHAWFFTPDTFTSIVNELHEADVSPFVVERIYPTLFQTLEFWVVLKRP